LIFRYKADTRRDEDILRGRLGLLPRILVRYRGHKAFDESVVALGVFHVKDFRGGGLIE
jgi:hypothetical protein